MAAFTKDHGTKVTTPIRAKISTSLLRDSPPTTDENKAPSATPLSPASKHFPPSIPHSTLLHRRFLGEVTMSPTTPARTPNSNQRDRPMKGRDSAVKGRESPNKERLELGQNGFYFSCELPVSKITPKKDGSVPKSGSPKKEEFKGTLTRRTPSPLKGPNPARQGPARALFGTTRREAGAPTPSRAATLFKGTSQSNGSLPKSIKIASGAVQDAPSAPIATLPGPQDFPKEAIDDEAAKAILNAPAVSDLSGKAQPIEKARTSKSSQPLDIGHLMVGLNVSAQTLGRRADEDGLNDQDRIQASEPPTPLRRAAERLPSTDFGTIPKADQGDTMNISVGTQTVRPGTKAVDECRIALDMLRHEQASQYPPPVFLEAELEPAKGSPEEKKLQSARKHVQWQDSHKVSSKPPKSGIPRLQKHVGTDPAVVVAIHKEMAKAGASMRLTTGHQKVSRESTDNNEMPSMSATTAAVTAGTAQRRLVISRSVKVPHCSPVRNTTVRMGTVATPSTSKVGRTLVRRGVWKSNLDTPVPPRIAPAVKSSNLTRTPLLRTPEPVPTRKPGRLAALKPYDPATDPRPSEKKFASAVDIADRIAKWHIEDREKAARTFLPTSRAMNSPNKSATQPAKRNAIKTSYTPQGSPSKLPSPIKDRQPHSANSKLSSTSHVPKTPARVKTAKNRHKNAHIWRTPASRQIGALDRNTLRTPSKAIESSLDQAIDAKIAEDAVSGKEFTPSGNRIRDLLEVRERK